MMRHVVMGALALGVGTGAFAQDVSVDYDKSADFSKVKTFTVKIGTAWGNPLGEKRVDDRDRGSPHREGLDEGRTRASRRGRGPARGHPGQEGPQHLL